MSANGLDLSYLTKLDFKSPKLKAFYDFYNTTTPSSEIIKFPEGDNTLQQLQQILYPREISAYLTYGAQFVTLVKLLGDHVRSVGDQGDIQNVAIGKLMEDLALKMQALEPKAQELKKEIEDKLQSDSDFRELLDKWHNAPRELRRIDLERLALEVDQEELEMAQEEAYNTTSAPSGRYASFQPSVDRVSPEASPPSSPRLG